jgi:hypothetical protein
MQPILQRKSWHKYAEQTLNPDTVSTCSIIHLSTNLADVMPWHVVSYLVVSATNLVVYPTATTPTVLPLPWTMLTGSTCVGGLVCSHVQLHTLGIVAYSGQGRTWPTHVVSKAP